MSHNICYVKSNALYLQGRRIYNMFIIKQLSIYTHGVVNNFLITFDKLLTKYPGNETVPSESYGTSRNTGD